MIDPGSDLPRSLLLQHRLRMSGRPSSVRHRVSQIAVYLPLVGEMSLLLSLAEATGYRILHFVEGLV